MGRLEHHPKGIMTEQEQNIAISVWMNNVKRNYTSDLNAIHLAEEKLGEVQKHVYAEHLFNEVDGYDDYYQGIVFTEAMKMVFAKPAQKAKALLKTLNKWTEQRKDGDEN